MSRSGEWRRTFERARDALERGKFSRGPFQRRLRLEPLEDRRMLANVTVSNLNDVVNGNTTSIANLIANNGGDGISLREAVLAANADAAADAINFSVAGVIQLTNVAHVGEIVIANDLAINGPGDKLLTIRAFAGTAAAGDGARIFNVDDGAGPPLKTVSMSGMTLTGGDVASIQGGGAISSRENLTLTGLTITGNSAGSASVGYHGGGIVNAGGNLVVNSSTVSGNTVLFGRGGGIYSSFGTMTIFQSSITGNFVSSTGEGGGVYSNYTTTNIDSSTIANNTANLGGGLVQVGIGRLMTVTNSTISENQARVNGGGVVALFGDINLRHCTITLNRADYDTNATGNGGGVFVAPTFSNLSINHTIVAGNIRGVSTRDDIFGAVGAVSAFNLVGVNTGLTGISNGTNGNQIGTGAVPIDAMLMPGGARDNGGPTATHVLLAGSPAIDAGDPLFAGVPIKDQRGGPFVRVFDGDGAGGARIDIGAYERQTIAASFFVVDTLVDEFDGNYSPGDVSLREAVSAVNGNLGADTISFAPALTAGGPATIVLTKGDIDITGATTINGPGANLLTIDASGSDATPLLNNGDGSRIFFLTSNENADMSISSLTLTGGDIAYSNGYALGGEIYNSDYLTLTGCVLKDNSADHGGGIANRFAKLEMINCTVSGNSGREFGGGIYSAASETTIRSSTISGNSAQAYGGGIAGGGPLTILDSTINGNSAESGGGIYGSPTVINCTIDGNTAHDGGGIYYIGSDTITIEASSISGNTVMDSGGAIYSRESTINISGSTLIDNHSSFNGGAIAIEAGELTIADCNVSGNVAHFGGGVYTSNAELTVTRSTFDGNEAFFGGGIYAGDAAPATISSSTISGNRALFNGFNDGAGGGIQFQGTLLRVDNSTISGNMASGHGGGIVLGSGSQVFLRNSTVTANIADGDGDANGRGGGIYDATPLTVDVLMENTIVARNNLINGARDDVFGGLEARFSLIGDNSGVGLFSNLGGNLIGTVVMPINPLLGLLADNGGPTLTHALLVGSPAREVGDPGFDPGDPDGDPMTDDAQPFDQRGNPFVRVFDGDGVGGARVDMGAFEVIANDAVHALFGDYNRDGHVNALDYTVWRNALGTGGLNPYQSADGNGDGAVSEADFGVWKMFYGETVPVPGGGGLAGGNADMEMGRQGDKESVEVRDANAGLSIQIEAFAGTARHRHAKPVSLLRPAAGATAGGVAGAAGEVADAALLDWVASRGDDRAIEGDDWGLASCGEAGDANVGEFVDVALQLWGAGLN